MTDTDAIYNDPEGLTTRETGMLEPRIVEKPWGREELLVYTDRYVMKVLVVHQGERLSVQYHREKMETLYVLDGNGYIYLGDRAEDVERRAFGKGMIVHIMPGTIHTFEAATELRLIEASTPEIWDVVRVEDRYGR